jgi:hypothetical protein
MSWRLVFGLSVLGIATAAASVLVIPRDIVHVGWAVLFFFVSAYLIAKRAPSRYFTHGFVVSVVVSLASTGAALALIDRFARHLPLARIPLAVGSPQVLVAIVGPAAGIVLGLVLGIFAWAASKVVVSMHSEFAGW